jgi:LysM repeat protein
LQPDSKRAELVRERIRGCKQELANEEFPLPASKNLQRDVDRLNAENAVLKKQLVELKKQMEASPIVTQPVPASGGVPYQANTAGVSRPAPPTRGHAHIVRPGETFTSIAAHYRIKTSLLVAANSRVNPHRLHVGQSLNVP